MVFGKARMKLLANEPGATADVRKVPVWKVLLELVRSYRRLAGRGAAGHLDSHRVSSDDPYGLCHMG